MSLNSKPLVFLYKDSFGIKYPMKVDMPLSIETKLLLPKPALILDQIVTSERTCKTVREDVPVK